MTRSPDLHAQTPPPLSLVDWTCIGLFCVFLLMLSYLHSRHLIFWGDEIMGMLVMRQPTWHALLHLWDAGIDSSGIWFYVLGRPWIAVFGASEVSLREFSAVGVAASAAVIWVTARRYYARLPVAAAVLFVFSATQALSWQLSNGRTYGIFLLGNALVIYMLTRGEDAEQARPTKLFLLATFCAYTLLAGSHILGFLYVAAYLGMQAGFDVLGRRFRPILYVSAACSFAVVWFSKANLISTAALGKPSYWTIKPALRNVILGRIALDHRVNVPLGILLLLVLVSWRFKLRGERRPVYLLAAGFVVLDLAIYLYSRVATSIYVDRYLVPFSFIAMLLFCELFTQLREMDLPLPWLRAAVAPLFLLLSVPLFVLPRLQRPWLPFADYTGSLLAEIPPGLPVIDTDPGTYVEVEYYHHDAMGRPFYFPVDWSVALDPGNTGGVSGFHEMDNFKATGLYADGIVPTEEILAKWRDFAVITNTPPTMWMQRRILSDPRYAATELPVFDRGLLVLHVWLVHRK